MDSFTLSVRRDKAGLWVVTSPDYRGLLVAAPSPEVALNTAAGYIAALDAAPPASAAEIIARIAASCEPGPIGDRHM